MQSEHSEQVTLINWVRKQEHADPRLSLLFAIPNGGARSAAVARQLQAEGVKKGVSDLFLPVPMGNYHGLWIELKADGGKPSAAQSNWLKAMRYHGYRAVLAVGAAEAIEAIREYMEIE